MQDRFCPGSSTDSNAVGLPKTGRSSLWGAVCFIGTHNKKGGPAAHT